MRERPILFNGVMVRAILAGQKTQTRRAIKDIPWRPGCNPDFSQARAFSNAGEFRIAGSQEMTTGFRCPFGQPRDRLWVRETWTNAWDEDKGQWSDPERYHYRADGVEVAHVDDMERSPWIPSIHMPRRACRLVLEITDVRVERLQAINETDAVAEGASAAMLPDIRLRRTHPRAAKPMVYEDSREIFADLWDSTGGDWNSNPWVWVITFKRIDA
ncbi:hypothetical protein [Stenotrophomonas maltophilia]|jgi:hypothetical protein|uniref:Morphogenetic protein n=1 Tax=Stenotrophomonas maltophilia TaxID=40324 RepID=A0A2J0U9A6_STEMA|nr:hypothetical protein [Stenotrophomonas maltophilia]PJL25904.1 hypothetical protein B9Y64_15375 [Stenotrophomonas maltophilia]